MLGPKLEWISLTALVLIGAFCRGSGVQPVEVVLNEEICSQCRMAVSQRQFAAEAVSPGGTVDFFDDIGCLARWSKGRQLPERTGLFVIDYETGRWLAAPSAHYVQSSNLPTPMGFGLAAYDSRTRAEGFAQKSQGRLLTWQELITEDRP